MGRWDLVLITVPLKMAHLYDHLERGSRPNCLGLLPFIRHLDVELQARFVDVGGRLMANTSRSSPFIRDDSQISI